MIVNDERSDWSAEQWMLWGRALFHAWAESLIWQTRDACPCLLGLSAMRRALEHNP